MLFTQLDIVIIIELIKQPPHIQTRHENIEQPFFHQALSIILFNIILIGRYGKKIKKSSIQVYIRILYKIHNNKKRRAAYHIRMFRICITSAISFVGTKIQYKCFEERSFSSSPSSFFLLLLCSRSFLTLISCLFDYVKIEWVAECRLYPNVCWYTCGKLGNDTGI